MHVTLESWLGHNRNRIRIALNGEDFRKLVMGNVVDLVEVRTQTRIDILLEDIGFSVMRHYIEEAERAAKESAGGSAAEPETSPRS